MERGVPETTLYILDHEGLQAVSMSGHEGVSEAPLLVEDLVDNDVDLDADDDDIDVDCDSFESMETISDNVSIWMDGEKHWVSGVDANTTCADLISALLSFQELEQQHKCSEMSLAITQEYVIVKQLRHYEEYLDGGARVFDVLPARHTLARKECELLLRHLGALPLGQPKTTVTASTEVATASPSPNSNNKVSSLLSTDKDSGMGSPMGSSRSARFRRRGKHRAATGARNSQIQQNQRQEQTLQPQQTRYNACPNERLMKIILAQDETIHRQLSLLREKERQILKIEEEKHRVRERELGKNYLLETYLNALDEAEYANLNAQAIDAKAPRATLTMTATPTTPVTRRLQAGDTDFSGVAHGELGAHIFIDEPSMPQPQMEMGAVTAAESTAIPGGLELQPLRSGCATGNAFVAHNGAAPTAAVSGNEAMADVDAAIADDLQIYWLEKIYAVNKQLQRDEELLLRLHAKVRKHQLKRAYQTKSEVLQQIDKLDSELAAQVADIHGVERKLLTANEQLKAKLGVLEFLSREFVDNLEQDDVIETQVDSTKLLASNQMNSARDLQDLRQLIAKPTPTPQGQPTHPDSPVDATHQSQNNENTTKQRQLQEQIIIDKNTHAPQLADAKNVKKQMFTATQSVATSTRATAAPIVPTISKPTTKLQQCHPNAVAPLLLSVPQQPHQHRESAAALSVGHCAKPPMPLAGFLPRSEFTDITTLGTLV
ncbi:uncharacterized protein LOC115632600 [Scaptodrosophila lebanonensis]|uniref:Uncharacterized protein LOC115632600 n=1 Tax=Drosophila lebanonensis TaxID=7225 RepID=A0A6J2UC99_DROLE|nr:uncharacterized protein LOC115632600 [Scaptodrosophila lebanonensis]